jgi:hypothetical protein
MLGYNPKLKKRVKDAAGKAIVEFRTSQANAKKRS